jgi:hypothetical protein
MFERPERHGVIGPLRLLVAAAVLALAAACSGNSAPTTTTLIAPTSGDVTGTTVTVSTTRAPGPLDPVPFEDLGVTVGIPHDWGFQTDALALGDAAALFVASNRAGGLVVIGSVVGVAPDADLEAPPTTLAEAAGRALGPLIDQTEGEPTVVDIADVVIGGTTGGRVALEVDRADGTAAYITTVVVPVGDAPVFIAFLYEDGFPENRVAQGNEALTSVIID